MCLRLSDENNSRRKISQLFTKQQNFGLYQFKAFADDKFA